MSESDSPTAHPGLRPVASQPVPPAAPVPATIAFDRHELREIFNLYGRMVASGEWRDYAMDFGKEKAVFSVYRRSNEHPLYRIEKRPALSRRQGAWAILGQGGHILRRGHELARVISVLEKKVKLVVT